MANMMDYMIWRGDLSFAVSPWNPVDALMMANLCYLDFQGIDDQRGWSLAEARQMGLMRDTDAAIQEGRIRQYEAMADTFRFGSIRMHHYISLTDAEQELQFSATCYDLPDGTLCIAFRGTDGTLVGWREDLNMSWQNGVPAQEAALFYLEKASEMDARPIRLVGHSKGGNLAAYAAACCAPEIQDRLLDIYTFDGPGMDPEIFSSEGYRRVEPKIRSFVPQTSIVGMMMEYHRNYTVVHSDASGFGQHDPLTWQVRGPGFETMKEIDANARTVSDTLHEWLDQTNREERSVMVDSLFGLLESTRATSVSDLKGVRSLKDVALGTREMDPASRKAVSRLLGLFLSLGFENVAERYRLKRSEEKPGNPEEKVEPAEKASGEETAGEETPGAGPEQGEKA